MYQPTFVTALKKCKKEIESTPVITISVYVAPRLLRQISCGTNQLLTVNHNISILGHNNTLVYDDRKYSVPFMTLLPSSTTLEDPKAQPSTCISATVRISNVIKK